MKSCTSSAFKIGGRFSESNWTSTTAPITVLTAPTCALASVAYERSMRCGQYVARAALRLYSRDARPWAGRKRLDDDCWAAREEREHFASVGATEKSAAGREAWRALRVRRVTPRELSIATQTMRRG